MTSDYMDIAMNESYFNPVTVNEFWNNHYKDRQSKLDRFFKSFSGGRKNTNDKKEKKVDNKPSVKDTKITPELNQNTYEYNEEDYKLGSIKPYEVEYYDDSRDIESKEEADQIKKEYKKDLPTLKKALKECKQDMLDLCKQAEEWIADNETDPMIVHFNTRYQTCAKDLKKEITSGNNDNVSFDILYKGDHVYIVSVMHVDMSSEFYRVKVVINGSKYTISDDY